MGHKRRKSSDGYERTGFANWVDYNPTTDTIRYGDWKFNPEFLGLKREKTTYDPKSFKNEEDVYLMLGASKRDVDSYFNSRGNPFYGPRSAFRGDDAWKNEVAEQLWAEVQKASGVKVRPQIAQQFGQSPTNSMIGVPVKSYKPGEKDQRKVYLGDDGMIYYEYMQGIPQDKAFAQMVSDKTWELSKTIGQTRYGKSPYDNKATNTSGGKTPTKGLLV